MKEQNVILQEGLDRIMREVFEESLEELHQLMLNMGQTCQSIIASSYQALIKNDLNEIEQIHDYENKINHLERSIEAKCMQLLLLQAPVATDLRKVSSALKMITDMERIGDHAYDIGDILSKNHELLKYVDQLPYKDMVKQIIKMVDDCITSFINNDKDLAYKVIKEDDAVDDYFNDIYKSLSQGMSKQDHSSLDLMMIAKYYERIGDHATNIAEWVIYSITNEFQSLEQK